LWTVRFEGKCRRHTVIHSNCPIVFVVFEEIMALFLSISTNLDASSQL
jgi:hypothetical protein